ncbi:bifunctional protein-serine/threonine kinase/phosphatase [Rheinheimera sp. MMS21-TC3]|uniref:bifunctional protein-serine/threonine kinase/phosphatase n=1 Tax=Rheinheimera sp. MMS21-TC3 TaxID=3072790 RepID=UPI0028C4292D|nr:bifunctional protein-serine/threonine kinase/phosphatase [Rheinheimera sp. MMS21-TC3]WNO61624.1 bifunctional protein-serine/threonine kinase/phosphatase [Rheinheimera sp. MMS21-TC3]
MSEQQLQLAYCQLSKAGIKPTNEDAVASYIPQDAHLVTYKGACFALADGVSTAEAGQQASLLAVQRFTKDYPQTPDSWSVSYSAEQLLKTINAQLYQLSHGFSHSHGQENKGYLTTFTALVLKSQTAHFFHVGDSRLYHLRDGVLQQLTQDHTTILSDKRQFLGRALGMDAKVSADYANISILAGDRFLLTSDGIHDFITEPKLIELMQQADLKQAVTALHDTAMASASNDNLSAVLVEVLSIPKQSLDDLNQQLTRLPFPPALEPGMKIDGYLVLKELFASSRSHLYLVKDESTATELVLKCPSINFDDDHFYIDRFIREEWIGLRIQSEHVVKVIRQDRPRTFLYYLMEYLPGQSLDKWFAEQPQPLKPSLAISLVKQIAQGLQAFHQVGAIHQDLKPGNVLRLPDGKLKVVDFGSVYVASLAEIYSPMQQDIALGTASYSDPQYLLGHNSGIQGDIYALATISYELFTGGQLPYGDAVEECRTAADYDKLRYRSASQFNAVIPTWFDRALEKGVSLSLNQRYQTLNQLLTDLQQPNPEFLHQEVKQEHKTNPLLFWQLLSGFWFITLLLVVWLFILRR